MYSQTISLQPGQIWVPTAKQASQRKILGCVNGMVSYATIESDEPENAKTHPYEKQSAFMAWIKETHAHLAETHSATTSPAFDLAQRVVTLRKAFGMTQEDLAGRMGISRSAIAFLETGRSSSVRKHIPQLAEIFQVPVDLFLSGMADKDVVEVLSSDEQNLITLYRALPSEFKLNVQKYIERQNVYR
ncbi:helix-turn-helix domain-containing protein [Acetobacter indonesiensis]|uniref:helix-turn-helix domain-containing protein n=1 Tax=Acetobacter indonesiensis TaxID=104101 RepID=UPI00211B1866|nr:helix-turn-helix transcriptional regulator [Acetobacter indonesiensis]